MSEIRVRQSYFTKGKHENMLIYSMLQATEEAQSKETNVISIWGWDQRIKTGGFYLMWSRSCSECGGYSSPWHEELFLNYLIFFSVWDGTVQALVGGGDMGGRTRDSVQECAASHPRQPLMTSVWLTTFTVNLTFYSDFTLEMSHMCLCKNTPQHLHTVAVVHAPPHPPPP